MHRLQITDSLGDSIEPMEMRGAGSHLQPIGPTLEASSIASWNFASSAFLSIPIVLFMVSLVIRPTVTFDSGFGLLVLRSMLEGGALNVVPAPDPADLARDTATFLAWWTPGQYLVPGAFVWLGVDYGLAVSLTTLIATLVGVTGWVQVARSFAVTPFVILVFAFGLVTFRHVTLAFQNYNGGEALLFAVAPWSLYALRWAVDRSAIVCLAISLLAAALLFFAKLTGLVVFVANVLAISLVEAVRQRRVTASMLAMWVASASGAMLFMAFWHARGEVPAGGSQFAFTWPGIWFPLAGATLSGVSGLDLLSWLSSSPSDVLAKTFVLGPLSLILMAWVWVRLRGTPYRAMAVCLFAVIAFYVTAISALYFRGAPITFHERHLRYAGILFFLVFLVAIDQWRLPLKALAPLFTGAFAVYSLTSYALSARELTRARYDDPSSGISQQIVSPVVLEYLRSEMKRHNWGRPIAVLPSTEAAMGIPGFRVIIIPLEFPFPEMAPARTWAGRSDKIFVVVQEKMVANGKADALLRSFVDYAFDAWSQKQIGNMVVYSQ
jgi:hypothetical protein